MRRTSMAIVCVAGFAVVAAATCGGGELVARPPARAARTGSGSGGFDRREPARVARTTGTGWIPRREPRRARAPGARRRPPTGGRPGTGGSTHDRNRRGRDRHGRRTGDHAGFDRAHAGWLSWVGTCASGAPSTGNATDCPIYPDGIATCPNANATTYPDARCHPRRHHPGPGHGRDDVHGHDGVSGRVSPGCAATNGAGATATRVPALSTRRGRVDRQRRLAGRRVDVGQPLEHLGVPRPQRGRHRRRRLLPERRSSRRRFYCERHETFVMRYMTSFPVVGGGSILARIHDSNCAGQQNCGRTRQPDHVRQPAARSAWSAWIPSRPLRSCSRRSPTPITRSGSSSTSSR